VSPIELLLLSEHPLADMMTMSVRGKLMRNTNILRGMS
jgi:hypothetical protein